MRIIYGAALLNGPFSIIVGFNGGMFGLIDRVKLRPMVAAKSPDYFYLSSEEAAVRKLEPQIAELWHPEGGKLVLAQTE
jgi:glutamate synthase domain-containing protein 1